MTQHKWFVFFTLLISLAFHPIQVFADPVKKPIPTKQHNKKHKRVHVTYNVPAFTNQTTVMDSDGPVLQKKDQK